MIRVVFIHTTPPSGGAGQALLGLGRALTAAGHPVRYLMQGIPPEGEELGFLPGPGRWEGFFGKIGWRLGLNHVHLLSTFRLLRHPWVSWADVVHLHNLHGGGFNYLALPRLSRAKPVVWTLHDQWAFTGHCAYSYACERWRSGCGKCPHLHDYPYMHRDASRWEWRLKRWATRRSRLTLVAPSRWLAELARQSFLAPHPIQAIPYGLDPHVWRPLPKEEARARWDIPAEATVALLAAHDLADRRKGADRLRTVLQAIPPARRSNLTLLLLGHADPTPWAGLAGRVVAAGFLAAESDRIAAYSAADLMLFGSRADNLPLVLLEAMACGCPALAFQIGGVPELVRPGETGWLAPDEDLESYRQSLDAILRDPALLPAYGHRARRLIKTEFPAHREAQAFADLYRTVQVNHGNSPLA